MNVIPAQWVEEDRKERRLAIQLHYLLIVAFFITSFFSPFSYFVMNNLVDAAATGVMTVIIVALFFMLHRGQLSFVIQGLVAATYIAIMIPIIAGDGIRDQAMTTIIMVPTGPILTVRPLSKA